MTAPPDPKPGWWPTAWWIRPAARTVEFIAVLGAMAGLAYEFWHERPKDRELRDVQLHATVASLAAQPNSVAASHAVQKILELMHRDRVDMTGISIPGITLRMAAFDGVDWSGALMDDVNFACLELDITGKPYTERSSLKPPPCASLRRAFFVGTALNRARFYRADISHSTFFGAQLSGIRIKEVDFSGAQFGPRDDLRRRILRTSLRVFFEPLRDLFSNCRESDAGDDDCIIPESIVFSGADLESVLFSEAYMPWVGFRGVEINGADFKKATLNNAKFGCRVDNNDPKLCTVIENACFSDADLTGARFDGVKIENSDFRGAELDNAQFKNVDFSSVAFDDDQIDSERFDVQSRESLETENGRAESGSIKPCEDSWRKELLPWEHPTPPSHSAAGRGVRSKPQVEVDYASYG